MSAEELISRVRSGIVQFIFELDRERVGSGSGFLVEGGIVTNSHVIREGKYDVVSIRFSDKDPADATSYIRISTVNVDEMVLAESPKDERDYAFLAMNELEFENRHKFNFIGSSNLNVGEKIVFLGFPFGMPQLTAHIGHISSIHTNDRDIDIIQIDGSVNGGNSGGPLLKIEDGLVAGIVTKAVTGLIEQQFNQLISALKQNQAALQNKSGGVFMKGIDPINAIRASFAAMEQIAINLKRTANVGIGYAYSSNYVRDILGEIVDRN